MKKRLILAVAGILAPSLCMASTYQYIDRAGVLRTLESASAVAALTVSAPYVIDSGVMLGTGLFAGPVQSTHEYRYVMTSGAIGTTTATSPEEAIVHAPNRMPTSGVQLVG